MDTLITLEANSKDQLNRLIDTKLKEGYLLKGGIQAGENANFIQIMVLPNNIDPEFTLVGAVKLVVVAVIYISVLYFYL